VRPKIWVVPTDTAGCGYMRMIYPALAAKAMGADVELLMPGEENRAALTATEAVMTNGFHKIMAVVKPECDVLVIQRALDHRQTQSIPLYQAHGVKVIVEVDDDFDTISTRNVAYPHSNPLQSRWANREWLKESTQLADLVTVTTPALAKRYGGHGRVKILPNFVPEGHLSAAPTESWEGLRVGWMGQVGTHPDDLQVMRGALSTILRRFDAHFYVVGGPGGVAKAASIPESAIQSDPYAPIDVYAHFTANMDVGIVPLAMTAFNQAKSALKGLEYAAVGLPYVASPTDPYISAHSEGLMGYLARKPAQWVAFLSNLLSNAEMRAEIGGRNREMMESRTIEAQAGRWIEAWESVCS